jgi:hypothetical protein
VIPLTLPLLVFEGNDLSVFDSVAGACGHLEAIDARNDEFDSFDGDGYPVELLTSGHAVVGAKRAEGEPVPAELSGRLRAYLSAAGDPAGTLNSTAELPVLIEEAAKRSR